MTKMSNEKYYDCDAAVNPTAIKEAFFAMMEKFNYPIYPKLKTDEFWFVDFKQADFANLGMGGIFWMNVGGKYTKIIGNESADKYIDGNYGYLGHEIYLLPNQTLPEHHHEACHEDFGAKMESWQIRYGSVMLFSEINSEGAKLIAELPDADRPWGFGEDWFKSTYYVIAEAGDCVDMADAESFHGMMALNDGAIVTEYATYHNHVSFSKPGMDFANSKDPQ